MERAYILLSHSYYKSFSEIFHSFMELLKSLCPKMIRKLNPFSVNFTKWSNTLKQFVGNLLTNWLSVFDHLLGLALKGLKEKTRTFPLKLPSLSELWVFFVTMVTILHPTSYSFLYLSDFEKYETVTR